MSERREDVEMDGQRKEAWRENNWFGREGRLGDPSGGEARGIFFLSFSQLSHPLMFISPWFFLLPPPLLQSQIHTQLRFCLQEEVAWLRGTAVGIRHEGVRMVVRGWMCGFWSSEDSWNKQMQKFLWCLSEEKQILWARRIDLSAASSAFFPATMHVCRFNRADKVSS